ncbi:MAG: hypothetical protein NE327_22590, partial [Lentisphaeraceae bacterium]|nr:hypothetical protein [Lentisphaeraceae bacterium]
MKYIEWNNELGKWFFNKQKAEQEVFLFATVSDVVEVGKRCGLNKFDNEIFLDFLNALKSGPSDCPESNCMLKKARFAHKQWTLFQKNKSDELPLYLGYLILFVLPLTEMGNLNRKANSYYPQAKDFFKRYELPLLPYQTDRNNWNELWEDLEKWSILTKNTELGYFELHPFKNKKWIYVGKPLSQSIFPTQSLKRLPQFFQIAGFSPEDHVDSDVIRESLCKFGGKYLHLRNELIDIIRDSTNELGCSIISLVNKKLQSWTGESDEQDLDGNISKKGITTVCLRLCMEGNTLHGYEAYYRVYTRLDYPENLNFTFERQEYLCQHFNKGWSKPLSLPFREIIELNNKQNKWNAKFHSRPVRVLAEGQNFHLNGWVETSHLVSAKMIILAKKEYSRSIEEWGQCFSSGCFKRLGKFQNNYDLFEIKNPPFNHPDIPLLQYRTDKRIVMVDGLKVGVRSWLDKPLPDVKLENGTGKESLYITYEDSHENIYLDQKYTGQPVWVLPSTIEINRGFYLKVKTESVNGDKLKNYISVSQITSGNYDTSQPPARNSLGEVLSYPYGEEYIVGNSLITCNRSRYKIRQEPYKSDFNPIQTTCKPNVLGSVDVKHETLLEFLTVKKAFKVKDYYEAFEIILFNTFTSKEIESFEINLSKLKRWSLNYLDSMGIVDYEYGTGKIFVNSPQFLPIPTSQGRKVLLSGGRTRNLMKKLLSECNKNELYITSEKQDSSFSPFLLPSTISVSAFG